MRTMIFIDGTNLLIRLACIAGGKVQAEKCPDKYFSLGIRAAKGLVSNVTTPASHIVRRHWFGSYIGDEDYRDRLVDLLRAENIDAHLFKRHGSKEKEVDIALTKEMLINAFNRNYDRAVLIAGDEDYAGLVQDLKRFGVQICGSFVDSGVSKKLFRACDLFSVEKDWNPYPWGEFRKQLQRYFEVS